MPLCRALSRSARNASSITNPADLSQHACGLLDDVAAGQRVFQRPIEFGRFAGRERLQNTGSGDVGQRPGGAHPSTTLARSDLPSAQLLSGGFGDL